MRKQFKKVSISFQLCNYSDEEFSSSNEFPVEEKEFEETLSIHDTVQYQKYSFLGEDQEEIKASKNKMELQHKHLSRATPIIKNKIINKIYSNTTNANMHIFGLKMNEKYEDKLEDCESPKIFNYLT